MNLSTKIVIHMNNIAYNFSVKFIRAKITYSVFPVFCSINCITFMKTNKYIYNTRL